MSAYRSRVHRGRWFFGFTLRRFSFFIAWKCDATMVNYAQSVWPDTERYLQGEA